MGKIRGRDIKNIVRKDDNTIQVHMKNGNIIEFYGAAKYYDGTTIDCVVYDEYGDVVNRDRR